MAVHPDVVTWFRAAGEDAFIDGVPRTANLADMLPNSRLTELDRVEVRAAWTNGWDSEREKVNAPLQRRLQRAPR